VFVGGARDAESVWRWRERSAYRGPGTLTGAAHADRDTLVATATAHGLAGRPAPTLAKNRRTSWVSSTWGIDNDDEMWLMESEVEEQIRYYAPARYLYGLTETDWTPDFTTIQDFAQLLGEDGCRLINEVVVRQAVALGSADCRFTDVSTTCPTSKTERRRQNSEDGIDG